MKPENEDKEFEKEKDSEKWIKDKKLIVLLRYGCSESGNISKDVAEYTLSGLDFSKLLNISPEITSSDSLLGIIKNMEFVQVPAGEFIMGSPSEEQDRYDNEGPVHKVTIKKSFFMGKYPVTQKQWIAVMGYNLSQFKGEKRPVESV